MKTEEDKDEEEVKSKGEKNKKRGRDMSDEEGEDELEIYLKEREKRAKVLVDLEQKFESEIGDATMANAVDDAEATLTTAKRVSTQEMTDQLSQAIRCAEEDMIVLEQKRGPDDSLMEDDRKIKVSLQH